MQHSRGGSSALDLNAVKPYFLYIQPIHLSNLRHDNMGVIRDIVYVTFQRSLAVLILVYHVS